MALVPGAGANKDIVNYKQHESCKTCAHFYLQSSSCDIVDGNISADASCNRWELVDRRNEGKDGEFYKEQYNKKKG